MRSLVLVIAVSLVVPVADAATARRCLRASGAAGLKCLAEYVGPVETCRAGTNPTCEQTARNPGSTIDSTLASPEAVVRGACTEEDAFALGYSDLEDLVSRVPEACQDFAEDLLSLTYAEDWATLPGAARSCQTEVADVLSELEAKVARFTAACTLAGKRCAHAGRDAKIRRAGKAASRRIVQQCGDGFDALRLAEGADLAARVDDLVARVVTRGRHLAGRVYPPNDLGPTAEFGPYPVGVRTLQLVDPARLNVQGTGPRPVTVELYYPSTAEGVAGVPKDVVNALGVDIVATPSYRDVARAPGRFPLVMFSHGNAGIRFQSFFFAAHLASHGYVVASPDHHGNTFVDITLGIADGGVVENRPVDMHFLLDQLLAFNAEPSNFLADAIDPDRVGMSGHSFGGYTAFALAAGPYLDPRVKAILPQAPAAPFTDEFFASITVPTLIVGGSIDETTPFESQQRQPYEKLSPGARIVALAEVHDAGHFTFSDFCEAPRDLLSFLGGFDEACEPRHVPWRAAHDLVNYLSLNFFDAALGGDADALARLSPRRLKRFDDLTYSSK